jgi:hypothetical protein
MSTDTRHGFEDGSYVTFHGVKGMTEVNDREFKIAVPSLLFGLFLMNNKLFSRSIYIYNWRYKKLWCL